MTPRPDQLLTVLPILLRPLVRLLLESGVTQPLLAELSKSLFVEAAAATPGDGRPATDSRISLATGIHRKEIRRLREAGGVPSTPPPAVTLETEIIARWLGTRGLQDADGEPLALPRLATEDGSPSFDSLVAWVTTDLRPRTVLDALVGRGLAVLDPVSDTVTLVRDAYVPDAGGAERLFFFARNLADHLAAACANVAGAEPAFPDASVHYDRLSPEIAARLEREARRGGAKLLRDLNRLALELLDRAPAPAAGARLSRVNLGVYLYAEPDSNAAPTDGAAAS